MRGLLHSIAGNYAQTRRRAQSFFGLVDILLEGSYIRMALVAQRRQVLAFVLRKGLILAAVGIGLGLAGAPAGTRLLEGLLFGVTPLDSMTFIAVSLIFGRCGRTEQ